MTDPARPGWFWAHDVEGGTQLRDLAAPYMRLQRIANYRWGNEFTRRFVALFNHEVLLNHGVEPADRRRRAVIDLDSDTAVAYGRYAVTVTADGDAPLTRVRFSLVLDHSPHPGRALYTGLDLTGAAAVFGGGAAIIDFATYRCDGDVRRFAVITEPHGPDVTFLPAVPPARLTPTLRSAGLRPLLVRPYADEAGCAVAVVAGAGTAVAGADLSADGVSRYLERHRATPLDIDALGGLDGVRFAVVANPGRTRSGLRLRRPAGLRR